MTLRRIQPRHVYASAAVAFALLLGFEGARMAAGHDPALGAAAAAPTVAPTPAPQVPEPDGAPPAWPGGQQQGEPPDDGGFGGGEQAPQTVPQPESRLS